MSAAEELAISTSFGPKSKVKVRRADTVPNPGSVSAGPPRPAAARREATAGQLRGVLASVRATAIGPAQ